MAIKPIQSLSGSPPHLRGKHFEQIAELGVTGITPAPAGKTIAKTLLEEMGIGSPPHLWGKRSYCQQTLPCLGITPAPAGKTAALPVGVTKA